MSSLAATKRTALVLLQRSTLRRSLTGGLTLRPFKPAVVVSCRQPDHLVSLRWFSSNENTNGKSENPEPPVEKEKVAEEAATPPLETTEDKVAKLEAQVKELRDQLLRSLAEQENTRRIAQRDIESARQYAIQSFAKSLLEVSDNLSMALKSVPEIKEEDKILKTLHEGVEMTERGLLKAFEKIGLTRYGEAGEPFDPNKHEALYEYADPGKPAGTIGQVMKKGFQLHSRVLRPAEVGVVKKSD